jgi:hypothetical protein
MLRRPPSSPCMAYVKHTNKIFGWHLAIVELDERSRLRVPAHLFLLGAEAKPKGCLFRPGWRRYRKGRALLYGT